MKPYADELRQIILNEEKNNWKEEKFNMTNQIKIPDVNSQKIHENHILGSLLRL